MVNIWILLKFCYFSYLGLSERPMVNKNSNIPSAAIELYKSMLEGNKITAHIPLPGLHTKSANTIRTYANKGIYIYIFCGIVTKFVHK